MRQRCFKLTLSQSCAAAASQISGLDRTESETQNEFPLTCVDQECGVRCSELVCNLFCAHNRRY